MAIMRRLHIVADTEQRALLAAGLKIAFASGDMTQVDQHFGSAKAFVLYAVDPEDAGLLEVVQFGGPAQNDNEDKLAPKIELLEGCAAVYCQAVGASAIRQLLSAGIQPVKVSDGALIKNLIVDIQNELRSGPSTWLAKAITKLKGPDGERFGRMEAEGWEE